jgi:glyoxylase-like metal-dependent hydrolase (beta-lactamase superfamily II)
MLLRASSLIYERLYLISLGATCRYAITAEDGGIALTDPGASIHVSALDERLSRLGLKTSAIQHIFLTHLDADRIAGIPLLRRIAPKMKVFGTAAMYAELKRPDYVQQVWEEDRVLSTLFPSASSSIDMTFDEFSRSLCVDKVLVDSESYAIDEDITLRSIPTPGHRPHSVAYLVVPHEFAIVDETFGYYRGRELCAPGGDHDITEAITSVKKIHDLTLSGIGFSYGGVVTGALIKKHIVAIEQNTNDLITETKKALRDGFSRDEVAEQIRGAFYSTESSDPCLRQSLERTYRSVLSQVLK